MGDSEQINITPDIAFQTEFSIKQTELQLLETKSRLKKEHPEWTIYKPQQGFLRIKNKENHTFNFSNENGEFLSDEWFADADDFKIVNGEKISQVWKNYDNETSTGQHRYILRPNGSCNLDILSDDNWSRNVKPKIIHTPEKKQTNKIQEENTSTPEALKIRNKMQKQMEQKFGGKINTPSIPDKITPEILEKLDLMGFQLVHLKLHIGTLEELQKKGTKKFLDDAQKHHPKWRRYDSLTISQKRDPSVVKNLEDQFFDLVKQDDGIDLPELSNYWIIVEKPAQHGKEHKRTPAMKAMGLNYKSKISALKADELINNKFRPWFEKQTGLKIKKEDARMLNALECNILFNLDSDWNWRKDDLWSWTQTEYTKQRRYTKRIITNSTNTFKYADNDEIYSNTTNFFAAIVIRP